MRRILYLLLCAVILSSCSSSKKYFQRGQYDAAINKAVKQIRKKPNSEKDIDILEKAYPLANNRNMERIKYLKMENNPESWDEILRIYDNLKRRQNNVKTVCPIQLPNRTVSFTTVDYDREIIEAKEKAADYYYHHALDLLKNNNDKLAARQAHSELMRVKQFYSNYLGADTLLAEAQFKGTTHVLISLKNLTPVELPPQLHDKIFSFGLDKFNQKWVLYYKTAPRNQQFDYYIDINVRLIDVSPESEKETQYIESLEIEDGFDYAMDVNGNVMKDTAGNDIKIARKKTIHCTVTEISQKKAVHIEGTVDYVERISNQVLRSEKIAADNFFDHLSAFATGDLKALKPSTRKKIGTKPIAFPPDFDMIMQAGETLNMTIQDVLKRNRHVIK